MGPKTASETQLNQQQALPVAGSVAAGEASRLFTITGPSEVINPSLQAARVPEAVTQPTYAPEAPTGTVTSNIPGPEAQLQPQAPAQNGSEGYYQISTPPPDTQPQPVIYTESAPVPQNPTQNSSEGYYQTQLDPRVAQVQAQAAMAIPTEPIKLTPQEFSSVSSVGTPSPALESISPIPTPEPVVVGADTSSPEFPVGSQDNLSQEAPSENSSQSSVDIEVLKKEYDPMVIEAIHKIMGLAEIQLAEAKNPQEEQAVIEATTNSLTDINRIVTGIKPLEQT